MKNFMEWTGVLICSIIWAVIGALIGALIGFIMCPSLPHMGISIGVVIGIMLGGYIGVTQIGAESILAEIGAFLGFRNKLFTVVCPHCDEDVEIDSEGTWTCGYCNTPFEYSETEEIQNTCSKTKTNQGPRQQSIPHNKAKEKKMKEEYRKAKENQKPPQSSTLPDIDKSYKILNCTENDTDQTIKQKYRKAVLEYHPDKIQSKNLPKSFHDFASQQVQQISNAYKSIITYRQKNKRS